MGSCQSLRATWGWTLKPSEAVGLEQGEVCEESEEESESEESENSEDEESQEEDGDVKDENGDENDEGLGNAMVSRAICGKMLDPRARNYFHFRFGKIWNFIYFSIGSLVTRSEWDF